MNRALAIAAAALLACATRTIDLGRDDATIDAPRPLACRCRVPCPVATATMCGLLISGSTCGSDGYCAGSIGICTATTPLPCSTATGATGSLCRASDTSTLPCP